MGRRNQSDRRNKGKQQSRKKILQIKEDPSTQQYARITQFTGSGFLLAVTESNTTVRCKMRGSLKRVDMLQVRDIILISSRPYDKTTYDVLCKYNEDECQLLDIPESLYNYD